MTARPDKPPDPQGLAPLAPERALALASFSSDVALLIHADGTIRTVSVATERLADITRDWVGMPWCDTASKSTRFKVQRIIDEANTTGRSRRGEISVLVREGPEVPVACTALHLGQDGMLVAAIHDLRPLAAIQQSFIQSQQALEQSHWTQRQNEADCRQLLQVTQDAVLMVDCLSEQAEMHDTGVAVLLEQLKVSAHRAAELCEGIHERVAQP